VALKALEGPLVALAGGEAKQEGASAWLAQLRRKAEAEVLFGAARELFAGMLQKSGYTGQVAECEGMAGGWPWPMPWRTSGAAGACCCSPPAPALTRRGVIISGSWRWFFLGWVTRIHSILSLLSLPRPNPSTPSTLHGI
jgi:hypothetical protein